MNNFATFWQRLAASGIDRLVFLPLLLLQVKVDKTFKRHFSFSEGKPHQKVR